MCSCRLLGPHGLLGPYLRPHLLLRLLYHLCPSLLHGLRPRLLLHRGRRGLKRRRGKLRHRRWSWRSQISSSLHCCLSL